MSMCILLCMQTRLTCISYLQENNVARLCNYRTYCVPVGNNRLLTNITALQNAVGDFVSKAKLEGAHLNIILAPELLREQLIRHTKSDVSLEDIVQEPELHTESCMQYVGPIDDGFLFYISHIAQSLKLQLQLWHHTLPVHMHSIISPFAAQLHVYKHKAASTFSRARLVQDIDIDRVRIPALFELDVQRMLKIDQHIRCNNQDIVYAWGSYLGALQ